MIELDVTLTRDHIPVVIHDANLDRTTDGRGPVMNFLSREISDLDAGSWFSPEFAGVTVPPLENVLKWAEDKLSLNIEIKKEAFIKGSGERITGLIHELIEEADAFGRVIVSSFSEEALTDFRSISPKTATAFLMNPYSISPKKVFKQMTRIGAHGINVQPYQMSSRLMSSAKENKLPVWVYTVNDAADMIRVVNRGGTGIFTNRPDLLNRVACQLFEGIPPQVEK
mgnify:FL=1